MELQGMDSTKRTARLAGLLYVVSSIPGAFALLYVPGKIVVEGNAAATAERLRSSEGLLRAGIAADLFSSIVFIFLALVLYELFRPVAEGPARAMLVLILLSFPLTLLGVVKEMSALHFAGGGDAGFLSALDGHSRDALAYMALRERHIALMVTQIFWGLWLFPFGICVRRSGFIPPVLGVLLMVAGAGYVANSFAALVLPQWLGAVEKITTITNVLELPIIVWLLIWGARPQRGAAPPAR
jgi:hypothetical protein